MRSAWILTASAIFALFTGCRPHIIKGEGNRAKKNFQISNFSKLDIEIPLDAQIIINPNAPASITIEGYENILKHIVVKNNDGSAHITNNLEVSWTLYDHDDTKAIISVPQLSDLQTTGTIDVKILNKIVGPSFNVSVSGLGEIEIDSLYTTEYDAQVSGACNILIKKGRSSIANYQISGAAKIKAFNYSTDTTMVAISGAGKMEVRAKKYLGAAISGAGKVKYAGNPMITQDISGAGSLEHDTQAPDNIDPPIAEEIHADSTEGHEANEGQ